MGVLITSSADDFLPNAAARFQKKSRALLLVNQVKRVLHFSKIISKIYSSTSTIPISWNIIEINKSVN